MLNNELAGLGGDVVIMRALNVRHPLVMMERCFGLVLLLQQRQQERDDHEHEDHANDEDPDS